MVIFSTRRPRRCFEVLREYPLYFNFDKYKLTTIYKIRWIKVQYDNPEVILLENGWSDKGEMKDDGRIAYFHDHLEQVLDAILNDGCNIKGYSGY